MSLVEASASSKARGLKPGCGHAENARHTTRHGEGLLTGIYRFTLSERSLTPGGRRRWHVDALPKAGSSRTTRWLSASRAAVVRRAAGALLVHACTQ